MWDLPGLVTEPMSPALEGRFFTTEPLGKPDLQILDHDHDQDQAGLERIPAVGSKSVMHASNAKINRASEVERGDEDMPADPGCFSLFSCLRT